MKMIMTTMKVYIYFYSNFKEYYEDEYYEAETYDKTVVQAKKTKDNKNTQQVKGTVNSNINTKTTGSVQTGTKETKTTNMTNTKTTKAVNTKDTSKETNKQDKKENTESNLDIVQQTSQDFEKKCVLRPLNIKYPKISHLK